MPDRLTPTQKAVQARGKTMYQKAPPETTEIASANNELWDNVDAPNDRAWRFTAAGLTIERELNNADWLDLTTGIRVMKSAQQLNVGDATLYGLEHGYIQTYEDMEKSTGYKASTIELFASLCRSIPRLVRTNSLTYSHYQQIAPLPEDERATWIQFAAANNLSYRALRSLIDFATAPQLPAGDFDPSMLDLPDGVTVERVDWYAPALSDEIDDDIDDDFDDAADIIHEKRVASFRKKAAAKRWSEIDMNEITDEQNYLARLRKKVAAAKVEADKQARMKTKSK